MLTSLTRLVGAVIAAACLFTSASAQSPVTGGAPPSRPLAVADLTALAAFGRGSLSPDGRWAVYEKRGAYDTIPRFEYEWRSTWAIMDLWVADLHDPAAPPGRLLPGQGPGLQRVAWSPSGTRLLISRFRDGRLEPGVVSMADRSVRWTGLTLDVPRTGAQVAWLSEHEVVALVRPDHSLPASLAYQGATQTRLAEAWERTALGEEPSRTILDAADGVASTPAARASSALVLLDVASGQARTLAKGRISDFSVSPDGRRVAIVQGAEGSALRPDEVVQFELSDRQRLRVVDIATGEASRPMDDRDVAPGLLRWSPDSRAVLVWARRDSAAWRDGALVEAGADGAIAANLTGLDMGSSTEVVLGVRADWLGDTPIVYARRVGSERFDWHALSPDANPRPLTLAMETVSGKLAGAGQGTVRLFADGGYWEVGASGSRLLTPGATGLRGVAVSDMELATRLKVNEAPRQTWAAAHGPQGETIILDMEGARRLGPGTGSVDRVLASSAEGELFLRRAGLSEVLLLRTASDETPLDAVNRDFAGVRLVAPEAVVHRDIDGREAQSWLFLPEPGAPVRGLVVKVYPGWADGETGGDPLSLTYGLSPQVFVAAGYAVLSPVTPQTGALEDRGDNLVRSVDLAVDAALAAHPDLPADRMAIFGHSFGGYASLEIAARSRRYRAYIASSAFSDMFGVWGEFEPSTRILPEDGGMIRAAQGWAETGQAALAAPPWLAPEAYAASSPYLMADRIKDPVLLLAADMDFVPLSQAERMYSALLRTGARARLVTYWGEHHTLWSPANIRDRFAQIFDWLELHLTSGTEPGLTVRAGAPTPAPSPRTRSPP